MKLNSLILGSAVILGLIQPGFAQDSDLLDGSNVEEILAIAQSYGDASLETQTEDQSQADGDRQTGGDPKIKGTYNGIGYVVYFKNCTDNTDCADIKFYAGFSDLTPSTETVNDWNRDKRFARAYLDKEDDAVLAMDIDLEYGATSQSMDAAFGIWLSALDQFTDTIGYQP